LKRSYFLPVLTLLMGALILFSASSVFSADIKPEISDALDRGDTTLALKLLDREIEVDKAYHLNYYVKGLIGFNRGEYQKAKEQFILAQDKKSKHYESLYYLGLCHLKLNEVEEALKVMEKGRKKAKNVKDWFENGYGLVMMTQENYVEADRAFRQAIIIDSTVAEYHINLGDANFYQGIPSLAVVEYGIALQKDTASKEVYFHWAEACLEMKDYNCAIEKLKVVLSKDSTHAAAWNRAGGIYFKAALSSRSRSDRTNRFKDVIGSYKKYMEISGAKPDSSTVRSFFELGMAYLNINAFEEAVKYFEYVLTIPFEPRDIYFNYGKALWGNRQYVKCGEILQKHIEWVEAQEDYNDRISNAELYQLLGDSYYYQKPNDFGNAIKYYKKSLEDSPNQKRIVQNVAVSYHTMKSYKQAIEYYDKRIELGIDTSSASLYRNAGYCALNIANNAGDEENLELEEEDEVDISGAEGTEDINYYEVAVDYMKNYLEYYPQDSKVLMMVGNTYLFQLSDCTNGVKYFSELLVLEPDNCDAKKAMGYAYFGGVCTKNYSKALNYLTDAYNCIVKSKDACSDVDLVLWIAQCYHLRAADKQKADQDTKSDFKNANEWYNKVLKCSPGNHEAKEGIKQTQFEF